MEEELKPRAEQCGLRLRTATVLWDAIHECHPQDAIQLMLAALDQMGAGMPRPTIRRVMVEAREWVEEATAFELKAYGSVCAEAMQPELRAQFIAYLTRRFGQPLPANTGHDNPIEIPIA